MQKQVSPLCFDKKPDEIERVFRERIRLLHIEPAVVDPEVGGGGKCGPAAPREGAQKIAQGRNGLELPDLQARADGACEIAHIFGDQKIMLHEPLDAEEPQAAVIAQPTRHLRLLAER